MKSQNVTIQMKATEQYFPVVLFTLLYKVDVTFVTCDQALFSFRSVKHSGGKGETKNRPCWNSSTERVPPTFLIDWHYTKQPIQISFNTSARMILSMEISHNGITQVSAKIRKS